MLRNFFLLFLRGVRRNKAYAALNVGGLALGMAAFGVILAYVRQEYGYDRQHAAGERVYRVESLFYKSGQKTDDWATSTNGYAPAMRESFPEIESYARINWYNSTRVVRHGAVKFREPRVCFADSNFFTFFSYPVVQGDPRTFLSEPNTVVLSERAARKYFGAADPLGGYLDISTINTAYRCRVTGVFRDLPETSTMQFDLLLSWNTSSPRLRNFWYQHGSYTFVRLRPGTDPGRLEAQFPALAERYKTEEALQDHTWAIDLVPLHDIHLNPAKPHEVEAKGNRSAVHFLLGLGVVILLMAWTNYVNLATARAVERAREAGIRKVAGSSRRLLVGQFLFESLLFNAAALLGAGGLGWLAAGQLLPYLGLRVGPAAFSGAPFYALPPALLAVGTVLAGLYPALVLSGVAPVAVLKGRYGFAPGGRRLRQGLVVLQFAASLVLIAGTLTVYRQLRYMLGGDLGVRTDQVLVLEAPAKTEDYHRKTESLKGELRSLPGVTAVTGSGAVPGKEVAKFLANRRLHEGPEHDRLYEMLAADYDFVPAYGLQLVAGRNFDRRRPTDAYGLVLNETAARQFGFRTPREAIGEKVLLEANPGRPNEIIGVIKDYHQQSLEQPYKPTILFIDPDFRWIPADYISLRISTRDVPRLLAGVRRTWNGFFPESSLDFFFLDEFYDRQYRQERQFGRSFLAFSALAVGVACLGLLGLTYYSTARRVREIGIRKVLGATAAGIAARLAWDTLKWVGAAALLAMPVAWYVMRHWLAGYAFRVGLHPGHLLLPAAALAALALLTVGYLTLRAARTNPADALRNE